MHSEVSYVNTITRLRRLQSFHTNYSFRLLPLKRMGVGGVRDRELQPTSLPCAFHSYGNPPAHCFHSFISLSSNLLPPLESVFVFIFFSFYCYFSCSSSDMSFVLYCRILFLFHFVTKLLWHIHAEGLNQQRYPTKLHHANM